MVFYELLTGELPLGRFPAPSIKAGLDARVDDIVVINARREPVGLVDTQDLTRLRLIDGLGRVLLDPHP